MTKALEASPYPDDCRYPAILAEMACLAEQPTMAAALIREGANVAQARQRLDILATVAPMMSMVAHKPGITAELKDQVMSGRLSVGQVRAAIFDALADADEMLPVDNKRPTGNGEPDGRILMKESMLKQIERSHGPEAAAKARAKLKEGKAR